MDQLIIFAAQYLIFLIAALGLLIFWRSSREQQRFLVVSALMATVLGFLLVKGFGAVYYHPRPFILYHIAPLIAHADDNGFPSEHTFVSSLIALLVFQLSWRWGLGLLALAIIVGWGRVAANVHWPVDIAGGLVIAVIAVGASHLLTRQLLKRMTKSQPIES